MAGKDTNIGAKRARELRKELGLDPARPLDCLLEITEQRLGIPVSVARLPDGVEGVCWRMGPAPMLWIHAHEFTPRTRFTLAHELGHVRCGHDGGFIVDTFETLYGATHTNVEVQANAFAAEFLAPRPGVLRLLDGTRPSLEHVVAIAACFGISMTAAVYRCVTLDLIDDGTRLLREIDEDLHVPIWRALDPPDWEDGLAQLDPTALPRLSPLLGDSALAGVLRGEAAVDDVARQIGCDPAVLAAAVARLGS